MDYTDRNTAIEEIRKALKARSGKSWSVTGGRGTAWGWIKIDAPPARRGCPKRHEYDGQDRCLDCGIDRYAHDPGDFGTRWAGCAAHVCTDRCPRSYLTPEENEELSTLLGVAVHYQGVSIPASSDYRLEYVARAQGVTPLKYGEPYWD